MQRILSPVCALSILGVVLAGAFTRVASAEGDSLVAAIAPRGCLSTAHVVVGAAAPLDAETACEGAELALKFLSRMGLAPPSVTTIEIVPKLPGELGGRAVGCYLRETRSIRLLTYEAFLAGGQWFRMQVDRNLYRAVAAHEMAHAVVGCHSEPRLLPVAAHEYVAYVVLFATMDPDLRDRLLEKFPGSGFRSTLQINDIVHMADPNQFAVDAWRHYLRRRDQAAWLRDIVAGQVVQEWPNDGP